MTRRYVSAVFIAMLCVPSSAVAQTAIAPRCIGCEALFIQGGADPPGVGSHLSSQATPLVPLRPRSEVRAAFVLPIQESNRQRRGVIGAIVGGASGILLCTAISAAMDSDGDAGCTAAGNLLFGGAGLVLGLVIGLGSA